MVCFIYYNTFKYHLFFTIFAFHIIMRVSIITMVSHPEFLLKID